MAKRYRNYQKAEFSPPPGTPAKVWFPDFSAEETILDTGDDQLPNTIELLKRPEYAAALHEFASQVEFYQTPVDTSQLSDDELANMVVSNSDLNTRFWSFYDEAKARYEQENNDG